MEDLAGVDIFFLGNFTLPQTGVRDEDKQKKWGGNNI
jgi:hypothetical protein